MFWNVGYVIVLLVLTPWLVLRRFTTHRYRNGLWARFVGDVPVRHSAARCIWLHAVSVGEVQVAATLVQAIQKRWPRVDIVVSTSTDTGLSLARARFPQLLVLQTPLDFSWAIRRTLDRLRPDLILLVELEVWPNWIRLAKQKRIPVAVVNGRLSPKSFRGYRRWRSILRSTFAKLDLVAVQDSTYAARFASLGTPLERIHVTGSVKFDGAESHRDHPRIAELRQGARITPNDRVWVVGSTQDPEEQIALDVFQSLRLHFPQLRLILVPRHPERFDEVAKLIGATGTPFVRWSDIAENRARETEVPPPIVLVDTIGDLRFWWGTADYAFVGGSLTRRGGQNMIEPAAYGVPVCFGPNTFNFRDVVEQLRAADAATVVYDRATLQAAMDQWIANSPEAKRMGAKAKAVVEQHRGATERTLDLLDHVIGDAVTKWQGIHQAEENVAMKMDQNRGGLTDSPTRSDIVRS